MDPRGVGTISTKQWVAVLLLVLGAVGSTRAEAQTAQPPPEPGTVEKKELTEIDLFALESEVKKLNNLRVTVASKREESLLDVPGNVTVHSADDMKKLGY